MSTDLRAALHDAVADASLPESDLRRVVEAGSRRVRRRAVLTVGASGLAMVAVAVAAVVLGSGRSDPEPHPSRVVHLDLSRARSIDLDVLASTRTTWREPMNDLDHDRLQGLTTDGLVLRSRYAHEQRHYELGLLDPASGRTAWLPPPPIRAGTIPVELTEDRLVLAAHMGVRRMALLVFDRRSQTWEAPTRARIPAGIEVHVPFRLALAPDGRLYLGSTFENDPRPMGWWSYSVPQGGEGRPEPDLTGVGVAWKDGVQARADGTGRVVLSGSGEERVVADERPQGCAATEPSIANAPVTVGLAGERPVVTYWCGDDVGETTTIVYDAGGGAAVQIAGASLVAADENHALLVSAQEDPPGVYLLDIDRHSLTRIGTSGYEADFYEVDFALANGLILWNQAGPIDDRDVYDEVWNVARLPLGD